MWEEILCTAGIGGSIITFGIGLGVFMIGGTIVGGASSQLKIARKELFSGIGGVMFIFSGMGAVIGLTTVTSGIITMALSGVIAALLGSRLVMKYSM